MQQALVEQHTSEEKLKLITNRANRSGQIFENLISNTLLSSGFQKITSIDKRVCGYKQFVYQATIGNTIYGTKYRVDFVVYGMTSYNYENGVVIQCKYQGVPGTADEKFPKLVLDIQKNKFPTIVAISGDGASEKSLIWLKSQINQENYLCAVLRESQIVNAIIRG